MNFITHCQVEFKKGNFFVLMNGPFRHLPHPWNTILIDIWSYTLFLTVTGVPIQFIFRYCLVINGYKLTFLEHMILLVISFFMAFVYIFSWSVIHWPEPEIIKRNTLLLLEDPYYSSGVPSFVTAEIHRIDLQITFSYCYFTVILSYGIIIFTSIKVCKHIRNGTQLSEGLLDTHKQITCTLVVQAITPAIVCLFPIALAVTGCFLYLDIPGLGLLVTLLLSWIPLVNPLVTIITIRTYRRFCFMVFQKKLKKAQKLKTKVWYSSGISEKFNKIIYIG